MCNPASMIVTKNKVYWSKTTDSHHEIITEFKLKEKNVRNEYCLVPIEIAPPNGDFREPLTYWQYREDFAGHQRNLPAWYDAEKAERMTRRALKDWIAAKVVLEGQTIEEITEGELLAVYGSINRVSGSATVKNVSGSATINRVSGSATINRVYGSAIVCAWHSKS